MAYIGNQITTVFPSSVTVDKINDVTYVANAPSGNISGRRNLVINGAMQVSQRSTSASSITSTGYHALDRFKLLYTDAGTWTMSQSSTSPNGFANSLKLDCTSAKSSLASNSRLFLMTSLEGQDVQQFKKGTSDAEQYTLSFHVRSNKTGTYQVNIEDNDNIRIVGSTYTISSADTWEKKEITFVADQTGAFADDTGDSLSIFWALAAGTDNSSGAVPSVWESKSNTDRGAGLSVNLADSTDNEWYITGVQLEVGSVATPFEHRHFGQEKQLCYRYYYQRKVATNFMKIGHGRAYNTSNSTATYSVPVPMRANPTGSISAASDVGVAGLSAGGTTSVSVASETYDDFSYFAINVTRSGADFTTGNIFQVEADNNTDMKLMLDAEI